MMEQAYARAIAWATGNGNLQMLDRFNAGLDNHRRWMREGR